MCSVFGFYSEAGDDHNAGESYLKKPSLPYYRLPAIENIKRNDPVVFNYPAGDSILIAPDRNYSLEDLRRIGQLNNPAFRGQKPRIRPIDKKDHYIKRCVGIPGDTLQLIDRALYINGEKAWQPEYLYQTYMFEGDLIERKIEKEGISHFRQFQMTRDGLETYLSQDQMFH